MSTFFIRAFFAIDLPVEFKQQLGLAMTALELHLKKEFKGNPFHWVKPQNLHLTLQFLGQVDEEAVAKLLQQVSEELKGLPSFYLKLGSLEWFPGSQRPRVLSLKAEPHEVLAKLAQALGKAAESLGYKIEDRPFRAHLTLARVEGLRNLDPELLNSFGGPVLPEMFVKEVVFFRSETQSGGSVYTRLASIELEKA